MIAGIERVVILAGGPSPEAAVSRVSGAGMRDACAELGWPVEVWELEGDWLARVVALPKKGTFVLLGLHGCPGEDGTVQAVLELLGLPYQGSDVKGSAVAMDKLLARVMMERGGVPVAAALWGEAVHDRTAAEAFFRQHGKVVVKPVNAGSTLGLSIIDSFADWEAAVAKAESIGPALVEAYVAGMELTVTVMRGAPGGDENMRVLPVIEIATAAETFYDYERKYLPGASAHIIPARIPADMLARIADFAGKAAIAVGARGICRVDFRYDAASGALAALEVNTLPGMTPTSLVPDAAAAVGMSYADVVKWMIEDGMAWFRLRM